MEDRTVDGPQEVDARRESEGPLSTIARNQALYAVLGILAFAGAAVGITGLAISSCAGWESTALVRVSRVLFLIAGAVVCVTSGSGIALVLRLLARARRGGGGDE